MPSATSTSAPSSSCRRCSPSRRPGGTRSGGRTGPATPLPSTIPCQRAHGSRPPARWPGTAAPERMSGASRIHDPVAIEIPPTTVFDDVETMVGPKRFDANVCWCCAAPWRRPGSRTSWCLWSGVGRHRPRLGPAPRLPLRRRRPRRRRGAGRRGNVAPPRARRRPPGHSRRLPRPRRGGQPAVRALPPLPGPRLLARVAATGSLRVLRRSDR